MNNLNDTDPWKDVEEFNLEDFLQKRDIPFLLKDSFKAGLFRSGLKLSWKILLK